jgi:hypothetical protein
VRKREKERERETSQSPREYSALFRTTDPKPDSQGIFFKNQSYKKDIKIINTL